MVNRQVVILTLIGVLGLIAFLLALAFLEVSRSPTPARAELENTGSTMQAATRLAEMPDEDSDAEGSNAARVQVPADAYGTLLVKVVRTFLSFCQVISVPCYCWLMR